MTPDRTCKRCSVARVNALIKAYQKAHEGDAPTLGRLKELALLVQGRGLHQARGLLSPGHREKDLRAICWNVSSFLEDNEVVRILGYII